MAMEERMAHIEGGFEQMNQRMSDVNQRINDMNHRINDLKWEFRIWFGILLLVMMALRFI